MGVLEDVRTAQPTSEGDLSSGRDSGEAILPHRWLPGWAGSA